MDFDFNLILVPATLFFVAVWLLDKFVLKQRQTKGKGNENFIITWAYDFWPVLAVVLVLRSFLYEPFNIPSDSMVPTLETGDFILVNKFDYGVKLPIVNQKFWIQVVRNVAMSWSSVIRHNQRLAILNV